MKRRTYLRTAGATGATVTLGGLSGCVGTLTGSSYEAANEFGYETTTTESIPVPLAPVADVGEWFGQEGVIFADTRQRQAYEDSRIASAYFSPAPDGQEGNDPVETVDTDTRIVTYCVCPHYLATLRAESLIQSGYEHTYALDEGLEGWIDAGNPVDGDDVSNLHLDNEYHTES